MDNSVICKYCGKESFVEKLVLKFGGILCPHCRIILFNPYIDPIRFKELSEKIKENGRCNETK